MFKNYIAVALRNLINHKLYSAINIVGLAIGLAACMLIALFVHDELSFDRFWKDADQTYRLHTTFHSPGRQPSVSVQAAGPAKAAIKNYFPSDVAYSTRFTEMDSVVKYNGEMFNETIHFTDPETVDIFSLKTVAGDLKRALNDKAGLAVSEAFARRYFGENDPIGEVLTVSVRRIKRDYRIAAVFESLPHNTVLAFEVLAKIDEADFPGRFDGWTSYGGQVFFKLKERGSIEALAARLPDFINANVSMADLPYDGKASDYIEYSVMALPDLQLHAAGWGEMKATGDSMIVGIFIVIASLILLIASINFMNLSTARSTQRAKEVVLRKVLGARRGQLIAQFMGESLLTAFAGLLLALVFIDLALPVYSNFLGRPLLFDYEAPAMIATLTILVAIVGLVGGVYPALVLSGFSPTKVLKANKSSSVAGSATLRNSLIVVQFAVSIVLIITTAVFYGQLNLVADADRSFNKNNLLIVEGTRSEGVRDTQQALKTAVLNLPGVVNASYSWRVPGHGGGSMHVETPENPEAGKVRVGVIGRGYDFLDTYEVPLLAGRDYDPALAADGMPSTRHATPGELLQGTVVVNERAVGRFGFDTPQSAIGKTIRVNSAGGSIKTDLTVIGVTADVRFYSLRDGVSPDIHELAKEGAPFLTVRYLGDRAEITKLIEQVWLELAPNVPFSVMAADDIIAADFQEEKSLGVIMSAFAILAVIIACIGLYGLASFTAERRTKEIGIRKALGAGIMDIVQLLVWQFSKPVVLANIIAWPLAIWATLRWLETFSYRLDAWILVPLCLASGGVVLMLSWATVGGNAAKVARANPINALRYE